FIFFFKKNDHRRRDYFGPNHRPFRRARRYNKLSREVRELACKIRDLNEKDAFRAQCTSRLLEKLYSTGLIPTKQGLHLCEYVSASAFCRRRLPTILVKLRMAQNLKMAITFIEQGHIRIGPDVVMDPAFLVTRNMEDFVTWVDSSKIKKHIMEYNEERDDFDLVV
uniref:U3 small nucleolar ribonucleoprotein protein IMP3 n=1 Tax=Callorhinchus milii TaxID=7868 RepID=A0A4W3H015_CALMI